MLQRSAHSIEGMAAALGAEPLREIAWSIESAAGKQDLNAAQSLFPTMQQRLGTVQGAVDRFLRERSC